MTNPKSFRIGRIIFQCIVDMELKEVNVDMKKEVKFEVVNSMPLIKRRGRSSLYPTSIKIIDALNELEYGKTLKIRNYHSVYSLRSCLMDWIEKGYLKDEYMLRLDGEVIYVWKVKNKEV